jgi:hypothetical protein
MGRSGEMPSLHKHSRPLMRNLDMSQWKCSPSSPVKTRQVEVSFMHSEDLRKTRTVFVSEERKTGTGGVGRALQKREGCNTSRKAL